MNKYTFQIIGLLISLASIASCQCPADYAEHPLILMSLDGFRPDYLARGLTPTISSLADRGASPMFMRASYPTVTFPNHYTIVTGLYAESHGIIANSFSDPDLNGTFRTYNGATTEGKWWGGEPIWNTVVKSGKIAATYFWPGSEADIQGLRPDYWYPYSDDVPFEDRVTQVLEWLALPVEERPSFISIYFNEPDHTGHQAGPFSYQVNEQLVRMDGIVKSLIDGIIDLGIENCTNLIIVSDHGMAPGGLEKMLDIAPYVPNVEDYAYVYYGANPRIDIDDDQLGRTRETQEALSCQRNPLRQFDKTTSPKRYHFTNNNRIEEIVIDLNAGYDMYLAEYSYYLEGLHGYDNDFIDMQALFIANGPDIRQGVTMKPFQNLEVYNLMCNLLNVEPVPTNGTTGALYDILVNPPAYPELPSGATPTVTSFPSDEELPSRVSTSECDDDLVTEIDFIESLNMTAEDITTAINYHLPWGTPYLIDAVEGNVTVLYHSDHITGYSKTLKMPLWTSYTLTTTSIGTDTSSWSTDVRLTADETQTCSSYDILTPQNMTMQPLFRPENAANTSDPRIPYLVSNAIPMTSQLLVRYLEMTNELIPAWILNAKSPLNVVAGVVFDNNFDSVFDDYLEFTDPPPNAPSEIFFILTRCNEEVTDLQVCPSESIDVQSFIYHQQMSVDNCLVRDYFAEEYSARVKDVELATGLIFYSALSYKEAMDLALHLHIDIWTPGEN